MERRPIFRKKLLLLFFFLAFCTLWSLGFIFAQTDLEWTETRYTEFELLSWDQLMTEWTSWEFQFTMDNYSLQEISWDFYFVDAVEILSGVYACKSNTETWEFWRYLSMEDPTFDLQPWSGMIWTVTFDFPSWYSGMYYGCIVYSSSIWDSTLNMASRKALPLSVSLNAAKVRVNLVANLWSRGNAVTGNNNWFQSKWKLLFYLRSNHTSPTEMGYVLLDENWHGPFSWEVLAWCYDVVYKWWHHLSTYVTNLCVNEWDTLDFVKNMTLSGYGLFATWLEVNGGLAFQIAWDMPRSTDDYDNIVNWTDLSVLYDTSRCPYLQPVSKWHVCDLNNDGRVDSSDASVILANKYIEDSAYMVWDFDGFGTVNYFD